jgi:hypothetical protein
MQSVLLKMCTTLLCALNKGRGLMFLHSQSLCFSSYKLHLSKNKTVVSHAICIPNHELWTLVQACNAPYFQSLNFNRVEVSIYVQKSLTWLGIDQWPIGVSTQDSQVTILIQTYTEIYNDSSTFR